MNELLAHKEKPRLDYFKDGRSLKKQASSIVYPNLSTRRLYNQRESLLLVCLIFCLIVIGVGLISQYSRVVTINYQIQQTTREINGLHEERQHLEIKVKRLGSLERIETIAKNDLGLQYPENRQWLFISSVND